MVLCWEGNGTKFKAVTIFISHVMDCQVNAIGKAVRLLFVDPVTNVLGHNSVQNVVTDYKYFYHK